MAILPLTALTNVSQLSRGQQMECNGLRHVNGLTRQKLNDFS